MYGVIRKCFALLTICLAMFIFRCSLSVSVTFVSVSLSGLSLSLSLCEFVSISLWLSWSSPLLRAVVTTVSRVAAPYSTVCVLVALHWLLCWLTLSSFPLLFPLDFFYQLSLQSSHSRMLFDSGCHVSIAERSYFRRGLSSVRPFLSGLSVCMCLFLLCVCLCVNYPACTSMPKLLGRIYKNVLERFPGIFSCAILCSWHCYFIKIVAPSWPQFWSDCL